MEIETKHLCSLIGRTFVIGSPLAVKNWCGDVKTNKFQTDYESLENMISYEEGDLTLWQKTTEDAFYFYFSMSSKIEVFSTGTGFVICDGLYFNESWDYSEKLNFNIKAKLNLDFNVEGGLIYVFDAVLDGESVLVTKTLSNEAVDRSMIMLKDGLYMVNSVETLVLVDGQEVLIKGIKASC